MKVLGLIEQDLDIVSKEYVDNKIKEASRAGDNTPEGYVRLDLVSLGFAFPPDDECAIVLGDSYIGFLNGFLSGSLDVNGKNLFEKYNIQSGIPEDVYHEMLKEDPIVYIPKDNYQSYIGQIRLFASLDTIHDVKYFELIEVDLLSFWNTYKLDYIVNRDGASSYKPKEFGEILKKFIGKDKEPVLRSQISENLDIGESDIVKLIRENPIAYIPQDDFIKLMKDIARDSMEMAIAKEKAHKEEPKIKILTENEYRFLHNKDANTLYIVREN